MDTEKCKVFLKAVDTGSFTKAAEELGYTPSGITHMMNALEAEVGVTLLRRSRSGVTLTEAGKSLIAPIRRLVADGESLQSYIADVHGLDYGHVSLGAGTSFARYILPEVIARFHDRYPHITLELKEAGGADTRQMLAERKLGLAFISRSEADSDFVTMAKNDIVAVVPKCCKLYGRKEATLEELLEHPYIGIDPDYDHDVADVMARLQGAGKPVIQSRDELAAIEMVRRGLGFSIVADLHLLKTDMEGICALRLKPRYLREMGIAIISPEELSPAEKKFIEIAKEVYAGMIADGTFYPPDYEG